MVVVVVVVVVVFIQSCDHKTKWGTGKKRKAYNVKLRVKGVKIQRKFQALGLGLGFGLGLVWLGIRLGFTFYALYPQPTK